MHLIICNERLTFRFGVDRVLLLLAQGLKAAGWKITLIAQRADRPVLELIADQIIIPPAHGGPYLELDQATAVWLRSQRHVICPALPAERCVALVGGWPFYSAIAVFREWGVASVAIDCGGVPFDSMTGAARQVQERLRALRREFFPEAQVITPISHFIARTQSRPDAGADVPISVIHLGSDHLSGGMWPKGEAAAVGPTLLGTEGGPLVLNLGRWETGNYKNSEAFYPIARCILAQYPQAKFAVLALADELQPPADLQASFVALGHPSDGELNAIMAQADLGVSVSRWEGFNLPLAEMQQLGKPVLVLDVAAHPEVVALAEQLCQSEAEIAERALRVLSGEALSGPVWREAVVRFRDNFNWQRTVAAYAELLANLPQPHDAPWPAIVLDASACLRDPANTGVARVVRSLARKLQSFGKPLFVAWDEQLQAYVFPTDAEYQNLGTYGGPVPNPEHYSLPRSSPSRRLRLSTYKARLAGSWLLQGEIVFERQGPLRRAAAQELGLRVAAIFYDAIPVTHPHWVPDTAIRDNHASYMNGLAECDVVLPISQDAGQNLEAWWRGQTVVPKAVVRTCWIAGELTAAARATQAARLPAPGETLRLLCVSTLEPRKNHATLLEAVRLLGQQHPHLNWQLDLIGNRYAGGDQIVAAVRSACEADPRIVWHGIVDDTRLNQFYAQAHLTIYPSLVEGYGMPIVESLWHARPCLCHDQGVMAQLAEEGGCLAIDMTDASQIASAIARLVGDPLNKAEFAALAEQALLRPILTWRSYARSLLRHLARYSPQPVARKLPRLWRHLIIPDGIELLEDAGQLALAALLAARPPRRALLLGDLPSWQLALIEHWASQVWQLVPSAQHRLSTTGRVTRIEAELAHSLPTLLSEFAKQDMQVDWLVVAGDCLEAASGVRQSWAELPALLLVAGVEAGMAAQVLGLPTAPDIELPGLLGYQLPVMPSARPLLVSGP